MWVSSKIAASEYQVSRQYIQKLEGNSNASPPSADLLPALAEILKVNEGFFYQPLMDFVHEEECFFRKQRDNR